MKVVDNVHLVVKEQVGCKKYFIALNMVMGKLKTLICCGRFKQKLKVIPFVLWEMLLLGLLRVLSDILEVNLRSMLIILNQLKK